MTAVLTQNQVVAPTVEAIKGTLLDAATVTDGIEWLNEEGLFESYNALWFDAAADFCGPNNKDLSQEAGWQDGFRFAAYGGATCRAVGLDRDDMLRQVEEVFKRGESTAVERALMDTRFKPSDPAGLWDAPDDMTPGGAAVPIKEGIALLEGYSSAMYVGVPTLHVPRVVASFAFQSDGLTWDGDMIRTKLGSKVAAGAGYDFLNRGPDGTGAAAGEKWLYATGEVVVRRGPAIVRQAMAHNDNEVFVLAERGYVVAVDSFVAAVRVTLT